MGPLKRTHHPRSFLLKRRSPLSATFTLALALQLIHRVMEAVVLLHGADDRRDELTSALLVQRVRVGQAEQLAAVLAQHLAEGLVLSSVHLEHLREISHGLAAAHVDVLLKRGRVLAHILLHLRVGAAAACDHRRRQDRTNRDRDTRRRRRRGRGRAAKATISGGRGVILSPSAGRQAER